MSEHTPGPCPHFISPKSLTTLCGKRYAYWRDRLVTRIASHVNCPKCLRILRTPAEWTDEATGLVCKARADFLSHWCAVVDLKSAADLSPRFLSRAVNLGYPCQMAHYRNGAIASGIWVREPDCVIVAVESKSPHDVGVFRLDEETLEYGAKKVAELLAKVHECTGSGKWPGRYPGEQIFGLPEWAKEPLNMTFEDTED